MVTENFQLISGTNGEISRKETGQGRGDDLGMGAVPPCLCVSMCD